MEDWLDSLIENGLHKSEAQLRADIERMQKVLSPTRPLPHKVMFVSTPK